MNKKEITLGKQWPVNLLDAISASSGSSEDDGVWEECVPADIEPSLAYVLASMAERERNVLLLRYRDEKTLAEIANVVGLSRERVHQIERAALRRLRHPDQLKWLVFGVAGVIARERTAAVKECFGDMAEQITLSMENIQATAANAETVTSILVDAMPDEDGSLKAQVAKAKRAGERGENVSLEDLDLSVRSYNCLIRAGVRDLEGLSRLTLDQLMRIRNLGRRSYEEVLKTVHSRGWRLADEPEGV